MVVWTDPALEMLASSVASSPETCVRRHAGWIQVARSELSAFGGFLGYLSQWPIRWLSMKRVGGYWLEQNEVIGVDGCWARAVLPRRH